MACRGRVGCLSWVADALATLLAIVLVFAGIPAFALEPSGDPTESDDPLGDAPRSGGATAAILPIAIDGEVSEVDQQTLVDELVEGLRRGAFGVVPPSDVSAADPGATTCANADCVKRIASATGATHVVRARVVLEDRDYKVSVDLYDGATGNVIATTSDNCDICGITEAGELMASAAATLRTKLDALAQGPATLAVTSDPVGAEIRIDGELVGTTPFEGPVLAGKHVLRISLEGYIAVEREVTFVESVRETLTFTLDKVPSRLPARPWGWAALGVGIASLGTSAVFLALDIGLTKRDRELGGRPIRFGGRCSGGNVDQDGDCRQIWDTDAITFSTAIVGATLVTLGIAILLTTSKRSKKDKSAKAERKKKTAARPRMGIGPTGISLGGRF